MNVRVHRGLRSTPADIPGLPATNLARMSAFTGRLVNFLSRRAPGMASKNMHKQVGKYRSSKGERGGKLFGKPVFVLDVVGRNSGESRPVVLMHVSQDDELLVCGSRGGHDDTPNWYKNLQAAGEAHVELGAERWAVTSRELEQGAGRDEAWKVLTGAYPDFAVYQTLTDRRLPISVLSRKGH